MHVCVRLRAGAGILKGTQRLAVAEVLQVVTHDVMRCLGLHGHAAHAKDGWRWFSLFCQLVDHGAVGSRALQAGMLQVC